jgi:hypothetical protein
MRRLRFRDSLSALLGRRLVGLVSIASVFVAVGFFAELGLS